MATSKPRTRKLVQAPTGAPHEPRNGTAPQEDPDARGMVDSLLDSRPSAISAGDQDTLMELLAGFTDAVEVSVKVYRVVRNKPLAYVYECSPETFSMDALRDDYGGGEFRVYIHKGGELIKNVRVMVEPPRTPPRAPEIESAVAAIRERQDKSDKLLEAIAARLAAPAPAPPSLGSMLGQMDLPAVIGAVGTLLQVIRPPAPPAPPPVPASDPMAGIEMFMKAFELARELQGDGGGEKSLMGVVSDLIKSPLLAQAVQAAGAEQQQQQQRALPRPAGPPRQPMMQTMLGPVPAPPQQRPPQQQPQPQPEPQPEVSHAKLSPTQEQPSMATIDTSATAIAGHMDFLCAQAANGADPELYGGLILDQLDDDTLIRLLNMPPDPVSALIGQFPQAAPHREWFEQVVAYVGSAFEEEEGGIPDPVDSGAGVTVAYGIQSGGQIPDVGDGNASGADTAISSGGPSAG